MKNLLFWVLAFCTYVGSAQFDDIAPVSDLSRPNPKSTAEIQSMSRMVEGSEAWNDQTKEWWTYINGTWVARPSGGGGGDNLGNHTATTNLNMADFGIDNLDYTIWTNQANSNQVTGTFDGTNNLFRFAPNGGSPTLFQYNFTTQLWILEALQLDGNVNFVSDGTINFGTDLVRANNFYLNKLHAEEIWYTPLATPPSTPTTGQSYFNSNTNRPAWWTGSAWWEPGSGGSGSIGGTATQNQISFGGPTANEITSTDRLEWIDDELVIDGRVRQAHIFPSGYIESSPVNFRFDADALRFANRKTGVTVSGDITASDADNIFSELADHMNLNDYTSPMVVEVTGLNASSSFNTEFDPYIFQHALCGVITNVDVELQKGGVYDAPVTMPAFENGLSYLDVSSTPGNLTGVRFTITFTEGSNCYIRHMGVINVNGENYQWTVKKGGDTMYGDLDLNSNDLTGANIDGGSNTLSNIALSSVANGTEGLMGYDQLGAPFNYLMTGVLGNILALSNATKVAPLNDADEIALREAATPSNIKFSSISQIAATIDLDDVSYDNAASGLGATNTQAAIDEIFENTATGETTVTSNKIAVAEDRFGIITNSTVTDYTYTINENIFDNGQILTFENFSTGNIEIVYGTNVTGEAAETLNAGSYITIWQRSMNNWIVHSGKIVCTTAEYGTLPVAVQNNARITFYKTD